MVGRPMQRDLRNAGAVAAEHVVGSLLGNLARVVVAPLLQEYGDHQKGEQDWFEYIATYEWFIC